MQKKSALTDWHPADIKGALEKRGVSVRRLSIQHGYSPCALYLALRSPWPKAERIIAEAIGIARQRIWPSRYHQDGSPKSGRGERGFSHRNSHIANATTAAARRNVENRKAA